MTGSDAADMATRTIAADARTLTRVAAVSPPESHFFLFTIFPGPFFSANWRSPADGLIRFHKWHFILLFQDRSFLCGQTGSWQGTKMEKCFLSRKSSGRA